MRSLIAEIFRFLFSCPFFRKRYYGFIFRIFQPLNLFRGITKISDYDKNLKIKLDLNEWIQQHIYFLGYFDPSGIRYIKNHLYEGEVFIDIGANVGSYSLVASSLVGLTGKVIAFEPATASFQRLVENVSLNGQTNVVLERKAVLDKNSITYIHLSDGRNTGMSSIYHFASESGKTEKVEAVSLDDWAEKNECMRISMIKMDIEGSEMLALKGMIRILEKYKPKILIELKEETLKNSGYLVEEIVDLLVRLKYSRFILDDTGNVSGDISRQPEGYYNYLFLPSTTD